MAAATDINYNTVPHALVVFSGTFNVNPASIADGATDEQTVSVPEAKLGDMVIIQSRPALSNSGLAIVNSRVNASNQLVFDLLNASGAPIDEGVHTYDFMVLRGAQGIATSG